MHEYLKTAPFDLPALHLFNLVAEHRSFTKAGQLAGLTQSAVTRQVQAIERQLAVTLFERTTRTVELTDAGRALVQKSQRLLTDVDQILASIRENFCAAKKIVRVGVSRSIGLAYLPGFFHANLRRLPNVGYRVSALGSDELLSRLDAHDLDVGVLCAPPRLPRTLRVMHRFEDRFALVAAAGATAAPGLAKLPASAQQEWLRRQTWILPDDQSNTGRQLRGWLSRQGWSVEPAMQLDNFDLIVSLTALGLGVAWVPVRALAAYRRRRSLVRLDWPAAFSREIVVVVRRHRPLPLHLEQFLANILFHPAAEPGPPARRDGESLP